MLQGVIQLAEVVKVTMGPKVLVYILLEFIFYLFLLVIGEIYKSMLWQRKEIFTYH